MRPECCCSILQVTAERIPQIRVRRVSARVAPKNSGSASNGLHASTTRRLRRAVEHCAAPIGEQTDALYARHDLIEVRFYLRQ
jgi:hypothetical protein